MKIVFLIPISTIVILASESPATEAFPSWVDMILQGGGTGVLAAVSFWLLTKTIPAMVKDFRETLKETTDRHDAWERQRHDDSEKLHHTLADNSEKLNETLRSMERNCAATRAHLEKRS